ncbi:hypothetical protein SPRG_08090 [Saprolegnia parasitica CBS 223.65]|uniref:Phosphoglycerate mutase n=1 Tax=Saprolegnia parasitica (strain CBS 223.65) TaxID=695850 RepID=A0A067CCA5_SAPPC|nr:hypothetical protein SPRG_08090 [Saprolegnia parasitica CBS 223.65]KDO26800.1 hypothetical protein SPRG_08090 [Saprolegnia parasitica CBS 223.65]|eukprot:XP_012202448.1 hypothetical protein SPRG_08090 [Saprolegnia parasitica CBS 223.65]
MAPLTTLPEVPAHHTRLYLCRHGETQFNVDGCFQGSGIDSVLTAHGAAQAHALGLAFRDIPLDAVFSSTLLRAKATAAQIQRHHAVTVTTGTIDGIQEMHFGAYEGKQLESHQAEFHAVVDRWAAGDLDVAWPGGESATGVAARGTTALEALLRAAPERRHVAVVCHSRFNRIVLASLVHQDLRAMAHIVQDNTCVNVLDYDHATRSFHAILINNTDHWRYLATS